MAAVAERLRSPNEGRTDGTPPVWPLPRGPVAYVVSRFPKLTETFVLYEVLALRDDGIDVRLFPLLREHQPLVQPEAEPLVAEATYLPFLSPAVVRSNAIMLATRPRAYLGALGSLVRETLGSANYLVGGMAIFPKVVHMARLMAAAGVVHVHCHFSNHPAAAGFVIHRLTGIPYSFTAHGSDLNVDRHMLPAKVAEAAFAVAISGEGRRVIERESDRSRASGRSGRGRASGRSGHVEVIHCGVDTDAIRPTPTERAGRRGRRGRSQTLSLLAVGTLHAVKGQAYLVEACRMLRDQGVDVVCRLVGDGPDEAVLRALIDRYGLTGRVVLEGRRTHDEIIALMHRADVLVAPSVPTPDGRREGIPVVLMEAMAAGVPVVASSISGIPELVEHERTGLLVPPRDPAAIAAAVRRLCRDPRLRRRLVEAGRERVVDEFDVRSNARRLAAAFAEVGHPVSAAANTASAAGAHRPFTVALVGADGAGKTTVGRRLLEELPVPATYLYMGVNADSANRALPTTRLIRRIRGPQPQGPPDGDGAGDARPRTGAPGALRRDRAGVRTVRAAIGAARATLRIGNRLAEEWYRQAIAWRELRRGRLVIFDRHFYSDYWATDVAAERPPLSRRIHGLILDRVYPKPELVLYLDAPPEVLLARKGEGTLESLGRKRAEYLELGRRLPHFSVVDAAAPEADVVAAARAAILAHGEATARDGRREPAAMGSIR